MLSAQDHSIWEAMGDEAWHRVLCELVDEGKFDKRRPEDDLAHRLASGEVTLAELNEDETALYEDRLLELLAACFYGGHPQGEKDFERMREPGYFDQPEPDQLKLL